MREHRKTCVQLSQSLPSISCASPQSSHTCVLDLITLLQPRCLKAAHLPPHHAMSSPLMWLGGSETDLENRRSLAGLWRDHGGSLYVVSQGTQTTMLSVTTTRPNGTKRFTKNLIDARQDSIFWGKGAKPFLGTVSEDRVTWRREGTVFYWMRLQ